MHEGLLVRLAPLLLMFGVLLAVALITSLRDKHRERRRSLPGPVNPVPRDAQRLIALRGRLPDRRVLRESRLEMIG